MVADWRGLAVARGGRDAAMRNALRQACLLV